jgi:hypothetical protein
MNDGGAPAESRLHEQFLPAVVQILYVLRSDEEKLWGKHVLAWIDRMIISDHQEKREPTLGV